MRELLAKSKNWPKIGQKCKENPPTKEEKEGVKSTDLN
jgi:hypothetical protein